MEYKRLDQIFTEEMIEKAKQVHVECKLKGVTTRLAEQYKTKVVEPNLDMINKKTKQENDPLYLAYLLEYAFSKVG